MKVTAAAIQSTTMRAVAPSSDSAHGAAHTRTAAPSAIPRKTSAKTTPSGSTRWEARRWIAWTMRMATPSAEPARARFANR